MNGGCSIAIFAYRRVRTGGYEYVLYIDHVDILNPDGIQAASGQTWSLDIVQKAGHLVGKARIPFLSLKMTG